MSEVTLKEGAFQHPQCEIIQEFEKYLFRELKAETMIGVYLKETVIRGSRNTDNNLTEFVYCYHCGFPHFHIPSGVLVRRLYIQDPELADQLYKDYLHNHQN